MDELGPHIAGLATALGRLAVAYRPRPRLVELQLMGTQLEERIHAAQMNDLNPAHRWIPAEYMEEAMFMMAVRASLDDVDPAQRAIDDLYDPQFVPDPAAEEDVAALPTATVAESGGKCPICLDDMLVGDTHHVLPCRHVMHHACTAEWFKSGTRCPACNASPFGLKGAQALSREHNV